MAGALIVVFMMLVVGPFLIFAGGAAWSALVGSTLDDYSRRAGPGDQAGG